MAGITNIQLLKV